MDYVRIPFKLKDVSMALPSLFLLDRLCSPTVAQGGLMS